MIEIKPSEKRFFSCLIAWGNSLNPVNHFCNSSVDSRKLGLGTADTPWNNTNLSTIIWTSACEEGTTRVTLKIVMNIFSILMDTYINSKRRSYFYETTLQFCYLTRVFSWLRSAQHALGNSSWSLASIVTVTSIVIPNLYINTVQFTWKFWCAKLQRSPSWHNSLSSLQ